MKQTFTSKLFVLIFKGNYIFYACFQEMQSIPPLILDGDELYLKISLKGVLNSQMSSALPSEKKAPPGEDVWHSGIEPLFQSLQNNKP